MGARMNRQLVTRVESPAALRDEGFAPRTAASELIDLWGLAQTLWRAKLLIAGSALLCAALAFAALRAVAPTYTAEARLLLDARTPQVFAFDNVLGEFRVNEAALITELGIITSREILRPVAERLDLARHAEFNPDLAGPSLPGRIIAGLRALAPGGGGAEDPALEWTPVMQAAKLLAEQVSADQFGESFTVRLQVDSRDPALAAAIANEIAAVYLDRQVTLKTDASQKAADWLSLRVEELRDRVETAELAVERSRERLMYGGPLGADALERQIGAVSDRLNGLRAELAAATAQRESFKGLIARQDPGAAARIASSATLDAVLRRRVALVEQIDTASRVLGPEAPGVAQLRESLRAAEVSMEAAVAEVSEGLDAAVEVVAAQISQGEAQVAEFAQRLSELQGREVEMRALVREAEAQRAVYEAFLNRLAEARELGGFQQPDARLVMAAEPPPEPSAPRKAPLVVLAFIFGAGLSSGAVLLRAAGRPVLRNAAAAAAAAGAPALGTVPWFARTSLGATALRNAMADPPPDIARAVCVIQASLWRGDMRGGALRVLVTSAAPGEGATALAALLARACAKEGLRTLLVDCDPDSGGFLRAQRANSATVETIESIGVDLALANDDAADVFPLLDRLQDGYDAVILDGRPVLSGDETLALARRSGAVVLAVRAASTPRQAVVEAAEDLRRVGATLAGVVLTRADPAASDSPFAKAPPRRRRR
jgi:uncharacterized protein involved in exopolysaccharide biosynthesis